MLNNVKVILDIFIYNKSPKNSYFWFLKNLLKNASGEFSVAILANELLVGDGGPRVGHRSVGNQLVPALAHP